MKKTLFTLILVALVSFSASAQHYDNAIGFSYSPGFSKGASHSLGIQWNHFLDEKHLLDVRAFFLTGGWGAEFDCTYEWSFPLGPQISAYVGPGVYLGPGPDKSFVFGVQGVGGFEYVFKNAPLAASLDWQPAIGGQTGIGFIYTFGYFSIGLKYCF